MRKQPPATGTEAVAPQIMAVREMGRSRQVPNLNTAVTSATKHPHSASSAGASPMTL
ncbi:hypothetical protein DIPPA_04842 [Diplonema papillatum]|nr:hypothetical protein DIPPA_04842 [Diplonema papillatum]